MVGIDLIASDSPLLAAAGVVLVADGRRRDIIDGRLADEDGTMSPLGEALDAGIDTAVLWRGLVVLGKAGVIPEKEYQALQALVYVKIGATAVAKARAEEIHPERNGKIGAALIWVALGGHSLAHALELFKKHETAAKIHKLASAVDYAGIALAGHASIFSYARAALKRKNK